MLGFTFLDLFKPRGLLYRGGGGGGVRPGCRRPPSSARWRMEAFPPVRPVPMLEAEGVPTTSKGFLRSMALDMGLGICLSEGSPAFSHGLSAFNRTA